MARLETFTSLLELVSESMPAAHWTTDARAALADCGGRASDAIAARGDDAEHSLEAILADPGGAHVANGAHRRALAGECSAFAFEHRGHRFRAFVEPLRDVTGLVVGVRGIAFDTTEESRAIASLRRSEEALALAQTAAHVGSWTHDLITGDCWWSDELYAICGRDAGSPADSMTLTEYLHADDRIPFSAALEFALEERRPFSFETRLVDGNGVERWVAHAGHFDFDERGVSRAAGTVQDVTARKRAEEHLAHRANFDELTGLPNRKLFGDRLERALLTAELADVQVAVLCIDLDRFKTINDTLGHHVGDQFLQVVTPRLVAAVGETDTIARAGGDEFLAVLGDIASIGEAARVAQRLVEAFSQPVSVNGRELYSSASIGIAIFPDDGSTPDELLRCAEAALYRAKERGKGTFRFYAAATHARVVDRLEIEHALRRAFDRQEFVLHYQPLVDRAERPVAVEALLRWNDPVHGSVGPDVFVPLCEEIGLIVPLGRWVIRQALEELARLNALGLGHLRMALNISARQMLDPKLTAWLRQVVEETGVAFSSVELEITESVLMGDVPGARGVLAELRALGLTISLDDFGTGYSSLSYLKHFDVDALKIDRSFVCDLPNNRADATIVEAVVAIGRAIGLRVVAEGVETAEQAAFVRRLGCSEMQGFYFAKPMAAANLERALVGWKSGVGVVS